MNLDCKKHRCQVFGLIRGAERTSKAIWVGFLAPAIIASFFFIGLILLRPLLAEAPFLVTHALFAIPALVLAGSAVILWRCAFNQRYHWVGYVVRGSAGILFLSAFGFGLLVQIALPRWIGRSVEEQQSAVPQVSAAIGTRVQTALNDVGYQIAAAKCADAITKERRPMPNRHEPQLMDELRITTCSGFEVVTYISNSFVPPKEIPGMVVLRTPDTRLPAKTSVGARSSDVINELGDPLRRTANELVYQADIEGADEDTITFRLSGDLVREIEWHWHFD